MNFGETAPNGYIVEESAASMLIPALQAACRHRLPDGFKNLGWFYWAGLADISEDTIVGYKFIANATMLARALAIGLHGQPLGTVDQQMLTFSRINVGEMECHLREVIAWMNQAGVTYPQIPNAQLFDLDALIGGPIVGVGAPIDLDEAIRSRDIDRITEALRAGLPGYLAGLPDQRMCVSLRGEVDFPKEGQDDLDFRLSEGLYNLGNDCARRSDFELAVGLYRRALEYAQDESYFNNLAAALKSLGRHTEALDCYAAAMQLAPDHRLCYLRAAATIATFLPENHDRIPELLAEYVRQGGSEAEAEMFCGRTTPAEGKALATIVAELL